MSEVRAHLTLLSFLFSSHMVHRYIFLVLYRVVSTSQTIIRLLMTSPIPPAASEAAVSKSGTLPRLVSIQ